MIEILHQFYVPTSGEGDIKLAVSNFIDSLSLISCQLAVVVDSVLFQEVTDFVTGCQEVFVSNMIFIASRELGQWVIIKVELLQELFRSSQEPCCLIFI